MEGTKHEWYMKVDSEKLPLVSVNSILTHIDRGVYCSSKQLNGSTMHPYPRNKTVALAALANPTKNANSFCYYTVFQTQPKSIYPGLG